MLDIAPISSSEESAAGLPAPKMLGHFYNSGTRPLWSSDGAIDRLGPAPLSTVNSIFTGIASGVFVWFVFDYVERGERPLAWTISIAMGGLTAALPIMLNRASLRRGPWLEWDCSTATLRLPRLDIELAAGDVKRLQLVLFQDIRNPRGSFGAFKAELQLVDRHERTRLICTTIGGLQLRSTAIELGRILAVEVVEVTETRRNEFKIESLRSTSVS